jgi:lipopolysaccharide/colanic/teichoic acid biosynthesis glycosyltransferase
MRHERSGPGDSVNRCFDLLIASTALVVMAPAMLLIALAILIESGRPIFFRQVRLGRDGRPFQMFKFRKFRQKTGASGLPLTLANDSRMSPVGSLLARTKMDELPQLFNIINGDMSMVGPRPESLEFGDCFTPETSRLLDYTPGLFGPSQVAFRHECRLYPRDEDPTAFYRQVLFPLKASTDLAYYTRRTFLADLRWIAAGVLAVCGLYRKPGASLSTAMHKSLGATPPVAAE